MRDMFKTSIRREDVYLNEKLLRQGYQVVRSVCSRASRLSSGTPVVSSRVLMWMSSCLCTQGPSLSLYLGIDNGMLCSLGCNWPKSVKSVSALVTMAGRGGDQASASKLSSMDIAFFVGPYL